MFKVKNKDTRSFNDVVLDVVLVSLLAGMFAGGVFSIDLNKWLPIEIFNCLLWMCFY